MSNKLDTPVTVTHKNTLRALKAHYEAHRAEALAQLEIMFNHPVSTGTAPTYLHELELQVDELARADEGLEMLEKYFKE